MAKILIIGAGGMAGSTVSKYLSNNHEVSILLRENFDVLKDHLPNVDNYEYVINCIGIIKQKAGKEDDKKMFKVNTIFPHELSLHCKKLIHISSDCVFSGKLEQDKSYKTNDFKDAEDAYGQSKADGEPSHNCMVLRTSIIGPARDNFGLFEWFRNTTDESVKGFTNHWWSGITTLELAITINDIINNDLYRNGIQQIASKKISKYDLLCWINKIFDCGKKIFPHLSNQEINRVLQPDISAKNLWYQLQELKKFMA